MGEQGYWPALSYGIFSPASIATGSLFSAGGSGQVAKSVYAQGRFVALLKSSTTVPSAAGASMARLRFAAYVVTPDVSSVNRTKNEPGARPLNTVSASGAPS